MPKYLHEQVTDVLRGRIRDGTYPPGSKLPTRRELCVDLRVSDIVIGVAMRALRHEGLVESLPGVGVYVVEVLPPVDDR